MSGQQEFPGLSISGCKWRAADIDRAASTDLANRLDIHPLLARSLVWRGLRQPEEAERFLSASLSNIPDPVRMLNMPEVERTLREALLKGEQIRIVGDYDCDGTTGLITLLQAFRLINPDATKNITYHVPDREKDGYGLNPRIIERAAADG